MCRRSPAPPDVERGSVVQSKGSKLKSVFQKRDATIIPGTANALFANVIEQLGFECAYVTGAGIANMYLGAPDIGLVSLGEVTDQVRAIAQSVDIPLLIDGDTGFGNAVNTYRTVRMFEGAGAAGIQLEDQDFPKKCGHFTGKTIIPLHEMLQKIHAAVDSRIDPDFQIIARTDAIAIDGLNAAIDRANAFIEAGADVIFVEAPTSREDLGRIAREIPAPQIVNIVHGGRTPPLPRAELAEMGFAGVLYANAALQSALFAVEETLTSLKETGSLDAMKHRLASFEARQLAVRKDKFDAMEKRYS